VLRIADGAAKTVLSGLDRPQGLTVRGDELFVVEAGSRQLTAVSLRTGETTVGAEHLPVGLPPGVVRPEPTPSPFPGRPRPFTARTTAADGSLLLGANGEGTVLRLSLGP
jgi:hypothetical protein